MARLPSHTHADAGGLDHALAAEATEPRAWDDLGGRPSAWTFLSFLAVWIMILLTVATTWPSQDHGTRMADSNILNAGRNFDSHGLGFHHGVPSLETYEDAERPPALYGTYPPGPYWIHAMLRRSGLDDLSQLRAASVVGAGIAGVLALVAFGVLTRSWLTGAIAAALYCFSAPFAAWSDSLHMKVWMQIALLGFLAAWAGFERVRGPGRWALLGVAALAYFADIWLNLEHVLLIAIVVAVRTVLSRRWSVWIGGAMLAGVALLGIASRLWHLTFEFDTIDGVRDYLTRKYDRRSGETGGGADGFGLADVLDPWLAQLGWPNSAGRLRLREFGYPLLALPVILPAGALLLNMLWMRLRLAWRDRPSNADAPATSAASPITALLDTRVWPLRSARAGLGWGVLLLLASLHWHVWMRQHASAHPHVILNMLPGMALILGSLAAGGLRLAAPDARTLGPVRALGVPLSIALLAGFMLHLRDAAPLNRLFPFSSLHQELEARSRADQWWRDLGAALDDRFAPVRRVVLFHWGPRQANLIGLPHQFVEGGGMPASFGMPEGTWRPEPTASPAPISDAPPNPADPGPARSPDPNASPIPVGPGLDLLLIEFPRQGKPARIAVQNGFARFGFPEIQPGPETTALVFSPEIGIHDNTHGQSWRASCSLPFAGGVRLVGARLSPTITGDAWVLCVELRGPQVAPFAPHPAASAPTSQPTPSDPAPPSPRQARVMLSASVVAPDGATRTWTSSPAARARHQNRSFLWVTIEKDAIVPGGEVRLGLTPRGTPGRIELLDDAVPAGALSLDQDADQIVWRLSSP